MQKNPKFKHNMNQVYTDTEKEEIKHFYRKVLTIQEEENKRISRDLHDETGQIVIALGATLNVIERELKQGNIDNALKVIGENRKMIHDIAVRIKSMARNLRPPALDVLGLSAVLRDYFSQCTKSYPIRIEFSENFKDRKLDENVEISLYRIVQEAMYNIHKHSEATLVSINLIISEKELRLIIEDNGKGFDFNKYKIEQNIGKMGLWGIRERVVILGGTLSIESMSGKGTKLIITLPLGESKNVD